MDTVHGNGTATIRLTITPAEVETQATLFDTQVYSNRPTPNAAFSRTI